MSRGVLRPADSLRYRTSLQHIGDVSGKVDVRKLAEQIRAMDESASGRQLFAPTEKGWQPIAA
jgi:hypothetical protein